MKQLLCADTVLGASSADSDPSLMNIAIQFVKLHRHK